MWEAVGVDGQVVKGEQIEMKITVEPKDIEDPQLYQMVELLRERVDELEAKLEALTELVLKEKEE